MMPATPLPRPNIYHTGVLHDAYERCLGLERNTTHVQETACVIVGPLLAARILGYLLREIPADTGRNSLAQEVNGCATDEEMRMLAQFYVHHFILAFKSNHDEVTPEPLDDSCGLLFYEGQTYQATLKASALTHCEAKMHALIRDHYRCHITRDYDQKICDDNELSNWYNSNSETIELIETEAAHIIPEPTNKDTFAKEAFEDEREWAATVWTVLSRFSKDPDLLKDLDGQNIHRLENIITMSPTMHRSFNSLRVWLEGTPVPNEYIPRSIRNDKMVRTISTPVVFSSSDPDLPVPSPSLIALHATCSKVANLSGAGEYVELMWRAIEETRVHSTDGSSPMLLPFPLNPRYVTLH